MRTSRAVAPGFPHHVLQFGNYGNAVFEEAGDYEIYLGWLAEYGKRFSVEIWAYCLMPNHVHCVCVPLAESGLARTFNALHMRYAQYFNARRGLRGHLWHGRFYSSILDEDHTYEAVRLVEMNPVRWRLVDDAAAYPWSSARSHVSGSEDPILGDGRPVLCQVDDWQAYLKGPCDMSRVEALRKNLRSGKPSGSPDFLKRLERMLGRKLERRPRGRPRTRNFL
jgi:putative transposase